MLASTKNNKINWLAHAIIMTLCTLTVACSSSIAPMGNIGSNKVYALSNNNFLTSNQMIVVLNKKGEVAAYSGGTAAGAGTVGLQTGATILTAGAIAYAGHAFENGVQTMKISGVPSNVTVNAQHNIAVK